ncbi:MAG: hypothetical protein ACE5JG_01150 [Planctomycetota bacterium]
MDAGAESPYRSYWRAWVVLLGITLFMVLVTHPPVLLAGMGVKALIITLWFMHLRHERLDFALYVLVGVFLTALVLFGLIAPDGSAM